MSLRNELPRSIADFDGAGRVCGDAPDPVLDKMHCLPCHQAERTENLYGMIPVADIPAELQGKVKEWRCYPGVDGVVNSKYNVDVRPARVLDDRKERVESAVGSAVERPTKPPDYLASCNCPDCKGYREKLDFAAANPEGWRINSGLGGLPS